MESQLQRPYDHTHDDDPHKASAIHSMVEDEGEHHHEKKSVLKKVKAKAKKIKDTIKKHGHGHEHEHEHDDHHNEEYEDEDEEEMDEDPEIHGAPVYESAAIRSAVPDRGINVESPTDVGEDRYGTKGSDRVVGMRDVQEQGQYPGQSGISLERPAATVGIVHAPEDKNVVSFSAGSHVTDPNFMDKNIVERVPEQGVGIGELLHDLQEDPNYARPGTTLVSNYETKITDPTGKGGEEAEMTSLIHSLDKTRVSDESVPKLDDKRVQSGGVGGYTGSHGQFAPQPYPTADEFASRSLTSSSDQSIPKSYGASSRPEELPRDTLTGKSPDQQSGYLEKISNATSAIADKALSAKNVVASKLGYGGNEGARSHEIGESKGGEKPGSSPTEYAHKVAATVTEKWAPVYGKVADAGSSVISKVKGSTTNASGKEGRRPEEITRSEGDGEGKVGDKGVSVKEYLSEKLKPGDEDKALSEVISETLHNKKKVEARKTKESSSPRYNKAPLGKVTESEEVARRLGSGTENPREGDEAIAAGSESTGKGVVDRIKDAVNLWVAKGSQDHPSEASPGSLGSKGNSAAGEVEERRLQESVN